MKKWSTLLIIREIKIKTKMWYYLASHTKWLLSKQNYHIDPLILLLGIYLKKMKTLIWKDICITMFIAELFPITKTVKQPKCVSMDEWIKELVYIENRILLGHKKNEILCLWQQKDFRRTVLCEISQSSSSHILQFKTK